MTSSFLTTKSTLFFVFLSLCSFQSVFITTYSYYYIYTLFSTNHIFIGLLYMLFGLVGGSMGWGLSIIISVELGLPGFILCSSFSYNSCITFHGMFMMFFFIMPLLIGGYGNLLMPMMICSSDMIFPRLNALSLWLVIDSLLLVLLSVLVDGGVNAGWTFYVPLSFINYYSIDMMFFSLHIMGLSSLLGSINFMITLLKSCNLSMFSYYIFMPLFPWSIFVTSLLLIMSLPVLAACITMVIFDRHFNGCFFDIISGGDVLLFQHLFWFFGHPEVYILMLPGFGLISETLSSFSQCIIFARDSMLLALIMMGMLGCMVWGHHMFMVGFDVDTSTYFMSATSIIAIPTAIKMLNWLATIWSGCVFWVTPMFFIVGFMFSFSFGGFTGLMLASCIMDVLMHDSYFVVAHFHYVLSLGALYSILASWYSYYMVMGISFYNVYLGMCGFITLLFSSTLMFLPQHYLGLLGIPRSVYDYFVGYYLYFYMSTIGAVLSMVSVCFMLLSF